jgi:hypothetical protein
LSGPGFYDFKRSDAGAGQIFLKIFRQNNATILSFLERF